MLSIGGTLPLVKINVNINFYFNLCNTPEDGSQLLMKKFAYIKITTHILALLMKIDIIYKFSYTFSIKWFNFNGLLTITLKGNYPTSVPIIRKVRKSYTIRSRCSSLCGTF